MVQLHVEEAKRVEDVVVVEAVDEVEAEAMLMPAEASVMPAAQGLPRRYWVDLTLVFCSRGSRGRGPRSVDSGSSTAAAAGTQDGSPEQGKVEAAPTTASSDPSTEEAGSGSVKRERPGRGRGRGTGR